MNAAVGVRRAGSVSPHTRTPGIARRPSTSGSNSGGLRRGERVHVLLEEEPGGGLDAGDRLEVGHPGLEPRRAVVAGRPHLEHRQLGEQRRFDPDDTAVRPVPLVRRGGQHIAAEGGDVDAPVGGEVDGVDGDPRPDRVGGVDDRRQIGDAAEQVRRARQRDPAGAFVDLGDDVLGGEVAGRVAERHEHVLGGCGLGGDPPRRDVAVVIERGADDAVAR